MNNYYEYPDNWEFESDSLLDLDYFIELLLS